MQPSNLSHGELPTQYNSKKYDATQNLRLSVVPKKLIILNYTDVSSCCAHSDGVNLQKTPFVLDRLFWTYKNQVKSRHI